MVSPLAAAGQSTLNTWIRQHWVSELVVIGGVICAEILASHFGLRLAFPGLVQLAVVLWLIRHVIGIGVWTGRRRRQLARASLPARGLLRGWWLERTRVRYIRKQWTAACQVNNITGLGKVVPKLYKIRSTVEGDISCLVAPGPISVKGGVDRIATNAQMIAETCGCRELLVRRQGIGYAILTFLWTEAMERVLPVADLPAAPKGQVAYGVRRGGGAATLRTTEHALVGGMTGSGKSGLLHAMVADYRRQDMPVDLYVSDPKGGVELEAYSRHVGERLNGQLVVAYARSVEETIRVVDSFHAAMKARQGAQQGRKITPDADTPLMLLVFDELIEFMNLPGTDAKAKKAKAQLMTVLSQGRAAACVVLGLTQLGQKTTLGDMRDMFPQRLCLATRNAASTDVILGEQSEAAGAACSRIVNKPGVGYSYDETQRGFELFRAAWVDDDDLDRIAEGLIPEGMDGGVKAPRNRQCAVYYLFTTDMQIVYIGKGVVPRNRWDSHAGLLGKPQQWWWKHVDLSKARVIWCDSEAAALEMEAREIKRMLPVGNVQHNTENPLRPVATVSPIRGRNRPAPEQTTPTRTRRRRAS